MTLGNIVRNMFQTITSPLGVLEDWAKEPLRSFENSRQQKNADRELDRRIREQTEVGRIESEIRMAEETHKADLAIRMQTEVTRINVEIEEWQKDQQFERMKKVTEAVAHYQKHLNELNISTIRAIGEMDIELREKAQNLVLAKVMEFRKLQDAAQIQAAAEFDSIEEKYSTNERIKSIMISASERKLVSIIENCEKFMQSLSLDILAMSKNIDQLTSRGQDFIVAQLSQFNQIGNPSAQGIPNAEDAKLIE